jgi:uncharacterized phage protein (TIGR01671 family)
MTQNLDRFKFRAYSAKTGMFNITDGFEYYFGLDDSFDESEAILMQCTGLKDKNGKLIYEGDIIQWYEADSVYTAQIRWNLEWGIYETEEIDSMKFLNSLSETFRKNNVNIIGNIYENSFLLDPELLEDE